MQKDGLVLAMKALFFESADHLLVVDDRPERDDLACSVSRHGGLGQLNGVFDSETESAGCRQPYLQNQTFPSIRMRAPRCTNSDHHLKATFAINP